MSSSPSISTNFEFFLSSAKFLVVLIVLNSNMAIEITSEMKQWINIAVLRHASFPVGKKSKTSQTMMFETRYTMHKWSFIAIDTHE